LPIEYVQKAREENNQRANAEMSKSEIRRRDEIHQQAEKRQEIGIDAGRGQNADDPVEQPFASGSYRACKGSHSFASANREFDFCRASEIVH
jgi:hypothetical protein